MRIARISAALAAITLAAAPIAAQANVSRVGEPVSEESELAGFTSGIQLAVIGVVALVIIGLIEITDEDDDDDAISA